MLLLAYVIILSLSAFVFGINFEMAALWIRISTTVTCDHVCDNYPAGRSVDLKRLKYSSLQKGVSGIFFSGRKRLFTPCAQPKQSHVCLELSVQKGIFYCI